MVTLLINAFANVIIFVSVTAFIVFVFGRMDLTSKFGKIERWIVKSGLCLVSAGALFNFLTLSTPPFSETLLNVGLAVLFSWAAIFHYMHFVNKKNKR